MPFERSALDTSIAVSPKVTSVAIDVTNASDPEIVTLHTPAPGHRFLVFDLFLQIETNTGSLAVLSGGNDLSGDIQFSNADDERRFANAPLPVFKGANKDEALRLRFSGSTGIQVNGFALIGDSER